MNGFESETVAVVPRRSSFPPMDRPSKTRILFSRLCCPPKIAQYRANRHPAEWKQVSRFPFRYSGRNVQIKTTHTKKRKTIIKVGWLPITEFRAWLHVTNVQTTIGSPCTLKQIPQNETCVQPSDAKWLLQMSEHPQQVTRGTLPSRN